MQLHELFSPEAMDILQHRAGRIAAPLQEEDKAGRVTGLLIMVQGEKYALPINAMTAVYRDVVIVPVPCTPDFVAGITNVRGHLVSVLDLAVLLGSERKGAAKTSMVMAQAGDTNIGFRVEAIGDVVELAINQISPAPANMGFAGAEYLQGILPDGTALLNMKAILEDPHLVIDESAG